MNHHDMFMDHLDTLLNEKNMTLNRLAKLADVTQSTLSNMKQRPNAVPRLDTLFAIAKGLSISVTELLDFPPYNERPDGSSIAKEQSKWDKLGQALTSDEKERVRRILSGEGNS